MSRDKQIEEKCSCQTDAHSCCACVSMKCHECFEPMQSKFVQGRFCSNCGRPLKEDVQRNYRKASDVAREIFEEIDRMLIADIAICDECMSDARKRKDDIGYLVGMDGKEFVTAIRDEILDLKKKYESEGEE